MEHQYFAMQHLVGIQLKFLGISISTAFWYLFTEVKAYAKCMY